MTYTKDNPPKVTRNESTIELRPQKFGKTSPNKGQEFWAPECTAANRDAVLSFVGDDIINSTITRFLRRIGIEIFTADKNKKEDGSLDWSAVLQDWVEFDTGGATLKDLNDQIGELQDQASEISDQMEEEGCFDENGDVNPAKQELYNELSLQLKELTNKIRPLKKQIKGIQDKYAAIAAKRQANKAPATAETVDA